MEQYIPKSAVVAEIESYINSFCDRNGYLEDTETNGIAYETLCDLKNSIDTLEVKEIYLEDSIKETLAQKYIDYTFKRHNIDPESKEGQLIYYAYMHGMNQCLNQLNK